MYEENHRSKRSGNLSVDHLVKVQISVLQLEPDWNSCIFCMKVTAVRLIDYSSFGFYLFPAELWEMQK